MNKKKISMLLVIMLIITTVFTSPIMAKDKTEGQREIKNVIVMVGDGMGVGQLEVARLFEHGRVGKLFMQTLPNVALMQTYSADNMVTDSAAAGTAMATGVKTGNGMVGVDENGLKVDSILDLFKANGSKVGVISTNTVVDATPAAFTASVDSRSDNAAIAREMLESDYDVLLGGGSKYFSPKKQDGVDLVEKFKEKGYTYASNRDELNKVKDADKLLGLFHPSYMNYKADREETNSNEPTLVEMQDKALEVLDKSKDGFFLMVEGARIDHAAHAADVTGVWKETIEFDNAVKKAVDFAKKDKETLVIVLADHETMGFAASEVMDIEALKEIEVSPEYMAGKLVENEEGTGYTTESVKEVFKTYANIELTDEEVAKFNGSIVNEDDGSLYYAYKVGWEIGSIIADKYNAGVMSASVRAKSDTGGHSGNMVPVFSYGPGSENFEGVLNNTDISKMISDIMKFEKFPTNNDHVKKIDILTTNDFHGKLEGGYEAGAAKLAAYMNYYKSQNPEGTVILDAGDSFQGTPMSNVLFGKPVVEMMNTIGYDATTIGNHEFDWGIEKALETFEDAEYEVLVSNIYKDGKLVSWAKPYTIVEKNGINIGIIGFATEETTTAAKYEYVKDYTFEDPVKIANKLIPEVKRKGADIVVLLGHIPADQDRETGEITGALKELAQGVTGAHAVIGGHSHRQVTGIVK